MRIDVHVYHHFPSDPAEGRKLDQVIQALETLTGKITTMSVELDRLTASVQSENTVIDSAVSLLGQLAQLIRDLPADRAAINALADNVDAKKQALADAVTANTPAA